MSDSIAVRDAAESAPEGWDAEVVAAPGGHVMQSRAWADHRRSQGATPLFVTFEDGRRALVVTRRLRPFGWPTATVRKGPTSGGDPPVTVAARSAGLAALLRERGAIDLFVDPEVDQSADYSKAMKAFGFGVTAEVQPSIHVMRLALAPGASQDNVFASIAKTTRQRIQAADKAATAVRVDVAGERLDDFSRLLVDRAEQLNFAMRPELGYQSFWKRLIDAGLARLYLAEHDGRLLGAILVYMHGGIYSTAYSADDTDLRKQYPGTMHLLRWTVIRDALAVGAPFVELGGVDLPGHRDPPAEGEPNHGLYMHKSSFGAIFTRREPARRAVLRPWQMRVATMALAGGAALRRLRGG